MSIRYQPGRYRGVVTSQTLGMTKKNENQLVLSVDLFGMYNPEQPNALVACNPGQRSVFRVINENTIDYVVKDLQYLGFDKPSFSFLDPQTEGFHDFKGQEVDLVCTYREYEGEMKENWELSRGPGKLDIKPADSASVRKLDALFGAKLKANAAPTAKPAAQRQAANTAAEKAGWSDDDPRF